MALATPLRVRASPTFLAPCLCQSTLPSSIRSMHGSAREKSKVIPSPTPFCPDPAAFLSLIGRKMSAHTSKFNSWNQLFGASSKTLKSIGIEPARNRRYLLWWRDQFRRGNFGIGGDMQVVKDGVGEVRVRNSKTSPRRDPVNVEAGLVKDEALKAAPVVRGVKVKGTGQGVLCGSHLQLKQGGSVAQIKVQEGLWEIKRGHKVHGGERRRKNVLSRIAARARGTLT